MADTLTNNLQLTKPEPGGSEDTWGTKFNANLDALDAIFAANGGGTSVGLNVGTGKTLTVAGTMSLTGTLNLGPASVINFQDGAAAPWIWNSEPSVAGGANRLPKYDAQGNLGLGLAPVGTWDSGGGASTITVNTSTPATFKATYGTEWGGGAVFGGDDFWGFVRNGYYAGGTMKAKIASRVWAQVYTQDRWWLGCTPSAAPAAGGNADVRWAASIDSVGQMSTYLGWGVSDLREKTDLRRIDNPLGRLRMLTGYTFKMDRTGDVRHAGLIAQELQQPNALPESVREDEGRLQVNNSGPVALLVECVKALEDRLIRLEKRS